MTPRSSRSKYTSNAVWALAGLFGVLALSLVPTPFYILAPGKAVDLSTRITVEGRPAARRRFYLTDVSVGRASVLLLAARLWPGVRIVRRETLLPAGESARSYDRSMLDAMSESQNDAAIVAERAAGFRVPEPQRRIDVVGFTAASQARPALAAGDEILRAGSVSIGTLGDLGRALAGLRPGGSIRVVYRRGRAVGVANVVTSAEPSGRARLGVLVRSRTLAVALPLDVHYDLGEISGSSGGLMFALEIYALLRPGATATAVAGTGTIDADGRVGPIEGVAQKLIAAQRAGVTTFLVPKANFKDAELPGMRVIGVATFREALAAIGG
jgi:PDZ domain-containing protein